MEIQHELLTFPMFRVQETESEINDNTHSLIDLAGAQPIENMKFSFEGGDGTTSHI